MSELPDFWRTEIWHPLSVHLPIGVLMMATLFHLVGFWVHKAYLAKSGNILLFIGTLAAWVAVYTGNLADGVVSRDLCDPTVLKAHEQGAEILTWLFTIASVLAIIKMTNVLEKFNYGLNILIIGLMLTGSGYLVYAGHLGAEVVYQQAAGVYHPSEDCREFIDE